MASTGRAPISETALGELLAAVNLGLPGDRHERLLASLNAVNGLIGGLDALDVGETPPASTFDARWR